MKWQLSEGAPEPLGVSLDGDGINVAVVSRDAEAVDFCLFDDTGDREVARLRLPGRSGAVFHGHISDVGAGTLYGLRATGPFDPANGKRFNDHKLLVDPYAKMIQAPFEVHVEIQGGAEVEDERDSAAFVPKSVVVAPLPAAGRQGPRIGRAHSVIYEASVAALTARHPGVPQALRGTFAALATPAIIGHLTALGVTTLELMPVAAWIDERHLPALGLQNHWGYNPVCFMAPDPRLAPGGLAEIRTTLERLHEAGIEVVLDVVFNHSGESDQLGATLSLRGLDNALYYRLRPDDLALYVNDTGCGHTLACDQPEVVRLVMDALRHWAHVGFDGFRFDLATILGRNAAGFAAGAPLLTAIRQDPVLRALKLIVEPWDIGPGGYQLGRFGAPFMEWNDQFRDDLRRFWQGTGSISALATRLAGSADLFAAGHRPSASLNFVSAHDGFTLADLVSFNERHNLANGEGNRDGTADNHGWNHGVEGPSADPAIVAARLRDQRNLLFCLMMARGTPMLAMGAELGHSQGGNNNGYAQAFALDWQGSADGLCGFVAALAAMRARHAALHEDRFLDGGGALPDAQWLGPDGAALTTQAWQDRNQRALMLGLYVEPARAPPQGDRVLVIINGGAGTTRFHLPPPRAGFDWHLALATAATAGATAPWLDLPARSCALVVEQQGGAASGIFS
ncbi:MAG: glycogen debranching protein GlgX [Hyphomicrobiales bacterium]|nr:glycogen debranching protein GlgX [Hyphomicrobiales bacterium]